MVCGVGAIEISSFKHADKELLGQILRLVSCITTAAQISVQWIPVMIRAACATKFR